MAKKNKPSGKRPAIFYQDGNGLSDGIINGPRIRIVYPDGNVEWCSLSSNSMYLGIQRYTFDRVPCYLQELVRPPKTFFGALELINESDKEEGFPEMIFIGEL